MFGKQKREDKKKLKAAHVEALRRAQFVYDTLKDQDVVITEGSGPGYTYVSAASPSREAWDVYWTYMDVQGQSAWDTQKWFDKELKR